MNAIKLPVRKETKLGQWWVVDDFGTPICNTGASEYLATQVTIAMNCNDALVEALEYYRDGGEDIGLFARAALAKVEDLRKTNNT